MAKGQLVVVLQRKKLGGERKGHIVLKKEKNGGVDVSLLSFLWEREKRIGKRTVCKNLLMLMSAGPGPAHHDQFYLPYIIVIVRSNTQHNTTNVTHYATIVSP